MQGEDVELDLWPGKPPGSGTAILKNRIRDFGPLDGHEHERVMDQVDRPFLKAFFPPKANGAAMLILPGGGYEGLWFDKEGYEIARHFNAVGITSFVLHYRLPGEGWERQRDVPLQDTQRAIRLVRARADLYGLDVKRIGIMGFSAGGHAAAMLATRFAETVYEPIDAIDHIETRPDFAALLYPVVTLGEGTHVGSRDHLLGNNPSAERIATYSCEQRVSTATPPTFIAHAVDDGVVPFVENAVGLYTALHRAKVPAELHGFEHGGHGFALRLHENDPASHWPMLFTAWVRSHKFLG